MKFANSENKQYLCRRKSEAYNRRIVKLSVIAIYCRFAEHAHLCLFQLKRSINNLTMCMKKVQIFVFLLGLAVSTATAQVRPMTIEQIFLLADSVGAEVQAARLGAEAAAEGVRAAEASRLPDVTTSLSASYLGDGYVWDRNWTNGMRVDIPSFGNNFALEVSQVIYAGGAITNGIALARQGRRMAEAEYEKSRQQMHYRLLGDYLNLYKAQNQVQVYNRNLALIDRVIATMETRFEQGTVLQNALTRYELQRESLRLQRTHLQNTVDIFNLHLVTALKLDEGTVVCPDTMLLQRTFIADAESEWQQRATVAAPDMQILDMVVESNQLKENIERSEKLPKVVLFAGEHLDGPITIEVPVLDKNFNYWAVGVGISYNISSLYKSNSRIRAARLASLQSQQQQESAQEQLSNAISEACTRMNEAAHAVEVQTKSLQLARENYAVTESRYANDLALITDMLDASNTLLSADLELRNAQINLIYSYYTLCFLSGNI